MTALITGIGYIGAALAETLLADGQTVVGLENGFSTVPAVISRLARHARFTLIRGSINSAASIERACAAATANGQTLDAVYHLAAQASAHPDAAPATYTEQTNLVAPRLVYEAAVRHGAQAFVYGSSFRVYGDTLSGTVAEDTPYGQIGDLSHLSKVYAEKLLEMLAGLHPLPAVSVRLGVVYGLGPLMKHDPRFLTVPNLFSMRATAGQSLTVHPNANRPIGFLHLDDAVQALRAAMRLALAAGRGGRAVNAVSEVLSVGEVAAIVEREAAARSLPVQIVGAGPLSGERWAVQSSLDSAGFRAARNMDESLGAVLDYYGGRR
ncbi:MAG: NAD-dependent epimerase/dehydratase family protein [Chloroflexota bacterium]